MTTFQIQCFLEAAKELNFSKAAQNLYISQPGISRHITTMEKELGVKLFERSSNKRIKLSSAGQAYYELYYRFIHESEMLKERFKNMTDDPFGEFSFGYFKGWDISFFLPDILETFDRGHKGVNVKFESLSQTEIISRLESGELDVALVPWEYVPKSNSIKWEDVIKINNIVLFNERFIQNNPEIVGLQDLKDSVFLFTPEALGVQRKGLMNFFIHDLGFSPKIATLPNDDTLMSYMNAGLGVQLTDSWGINAHSQGYYGLRLSSPRRIVLIWPASIKHNMPLQIVSELRTVLESLQDDIGCFTIFDHSNEFDASDFYY